MDLTEEALEDFQQHQELPSEALRAAADALERGELPRPYPRVILAALARDTARKLEA